MLKPGPEGWDKYIELVAEAYRSAPMFEERAVGGFLVMMPYLAKIDKQIKSVVDVEEVPYHAYRSAKGMARRVKKTGKFKVSTADSEHPIFSNEFKETIIPSSDDPAVLEQADQLFHHYMDQMNKGVPGLDQKYSIEERNMLKEQLRQMDFARANFFFRTVHDFQGHIQGGYAFSKKGEWSSYNKHVKLVPNACIPVLFTEIPGQISCFYSSGKKNCIQKAIILDGFDYINLGVIEGYDIVDKNLIKQAEEA